MLRLHPEYSSVRLAAEIGISQKGVEKQLSILKTQGMIKREGPDKGGRWIVAEDAARKAVEGLDMP